jgi:hypothetical protein
LRLQGGDDACTRLVTLKVLSPSPSALARALRGRPPWR